MWLNQKPRAETTDLASLPTCQQYLGQTSLAAVFVTRVGATVVPCSNPKGQGVQDELRV